MSAEDYFEKADAAQRNMGSGGGSRSSSSQDDPFIYMGINPAGARAGRPVSVSTQRPAYFKDRGRSVNGFTPSSSGAYGTPMSEALGLMHLWWGTKRAEEWQQTLIDLQMIDPADKSNFDTVAGLWQTAVKAAADFQKAGRGNITPWDAIKILAGDEQARARRGAGFAGASGGPKTTTSTSINLTDPTTAKALVNDTLSKMLGRRASDEEISQFTKVLNAAEHKSPSVTTTHYNADGSQQSSSTTGGMTQAGASSLLEDQAMNLPDYGAYQAAGFYGNILMNALNSPVG